MIDFNAWKLRGTSNVLRYKKAVQKGVHSKGFLGAVHKSCHLLSGGWGKENNDKYATLKVDDEIIELWGGWESA